MHPSPHWSTAAAAAVTVAATKIVPCHRLWQGGTGTYLSVRVGAHGAIEEEPLYRPVYEAMPATEDGAIAEHVLVQPQTPASPRFPNPIYESADLPPPALPAVPPPTFHRPSVESVGYAQVYTCH